MKKVLIVANVAKEHILKFHVPTIKMLKDKGYQVDVACSGEEDVPYCDHQYRMKYKRNPFTIHTITGIFELRKIIKEVKYDVVHCHTPTGGLVARLACAFLREKPYVIYNAHGFHFFKGASIINWLLIFPVEWILSFFNDCLMVVNKEDYENAKKFHFGMKRLETIHEVGVDKNKFNISLSKEEKDAIKKELKVENKIILSYVAEVLPNKNQQVLLKMMTYLDKEKYHLLLIGPIHDDGNYEKLAKELNVNNVSFLGWRSDIPQLLRITDIYVASSIREGLGLNLVEAQYSQVPVIASINSIRFDGDMAGASCS